MNKYASIIIVSIFTFACNSGKTKDKLIEGDLYFSSFRFGSFYNEPDSIIKAVTTYADTANQNGMDSMDKKILTMYEILKKEHLLYSPYIDLRLDNDSTIKIYFKTPDYEKIKIYKWKELLETDKKIRIKMNISDLGEAMAFCTELISVEKVDGKTSQRSKKWKIEDYQ